MLSDPAPHGQQTTGAAPTVPSVQESHGVAAKLTSATGQPATAGLATSYRLRAAAHGAPRIAAPARNRTVQSRAAARDARH